MSEKPSSVKELISQMSVAIEGKTIINNEGKLPSEKELMKRYDVSRYAVRQALSQLGERGIIYQTHGIGSFVRQEEQLPTGKVRNNIGVTSDVSSSLNLITVKASQSQVKLSEADFLPVHLKLPDDTELIEIIRYRSLEGRPYQVEKSYYLKDLIETIPDQQLYDSLFSYYEAKSELKVGFIDKVIRCELLEESAANFFGLVSGGPTLVERDDTYLSTGKLLAFSKICYDYRLGELYLSKKIY